ncbi:MAG TPA: tetratricopeptide repeat protein, partial [Planctomycetia bacterium]|nr:tetratricopeptide repeat protein [Planctomycetia bacterium]
HHAVNVLLHLAATLLLFRALTQLTGERGASFVAAAIWAVHPLHVETVAWIAERKGLLANLAWAGCLHAYAVYARSGSRGAFVALHAWMIAGMLSKQSLVTLPFALLLLDWWPLRKLEWKSFPALVKEKAGLFLLAAIFSAVAFAAQRQGGALPGLDSCSLRDRVENAALAIGEYVNDEFWPCGLAVWYPHWVHVKDLLAPPSVHLISWLAILGGAFGFRRTMPWLLWGVLWFLGTLLPMAGLVQVGLHGRADRYMDIPSIGVIVATVWGARQAISNVAFRMILATTVVAALAGLAVVQVGHWRNSFLLFRHADAVTKGNFVAKDQLGLAYLERARGAEDQEVQTRDLEEAIKLFDEAIALHPGHYPPHNNKGQALALAGRLDEAIASFKQALAVHPSSPEAAANLGIALSQQNKLEEAAKWLEQARDRAPRNDGVLRNLGVIYARQERLAAALAMFEETVRINPLAAENHLNLALALKGAGRKAEADAAFRRAAGAAQAAGNRALVERIHGLAQ